MRGGWPVQGLSFPRKSTGPVAGKEGELITIVDNEIARDNVLRLCRAGIWKRRLRRRPAIIISASASRNIRGLSPSWPGKDLVFLIGSELLGRGSDELGQILSRSFFHTLAQSEILPAALIFINSGVKLACEDLPVLSNLLELDRQGVHILACGTCLDYFGLKNKLCVGTVSNMYTIVEQLTQYPRVVALP